MPNKDFKVKNKLQVAGITSAGPVVSDATGNLDSTPFIATQYGGTGTSTSPTSGQVLYSAAGTTYAPTTLSTIVTQQTPTDGASGTKTYVGTTTPSSPVTGDVWIDSSAGNLPTLQRWSKTAAGGETSLSGIDDNNITLTYVVGTEQVYQNGVLLVRNVDYTATNGTSISFTSALVAGDSVNVLSFLGGSVADTYTQAQANSTFYPVATTQIAGKNKIINGNFSINQRSFSSTTSTGFGFDRFNNQLSGGTVTFSSQTFTPGTAPVTGYEASNYLQIASSGQSTANDYAAIKQPIEDVRTFAGQTVTLSFWAKAASGTPNIGVTLYQGFGNGGSSYVNTSPLVQTITTSWARYSFVINVPSIVGKTIGANSSLDAWIFTSAGGNVSGIYGYAAVGVQNATIGIWGVQLEAGSVATQFTTASGTIQGELALCQRYYYRATSLNNLYENFGFGMTNSSTTGGNMQISFPVTMRTAPTSLDYSTLRVSDFANGYAVTVLTLNGNQNSRWIGNCGFSVASGLTAFRSYSLQSNNSNAGYIGFSAEL